MKTTNEPTNPAPVWRLLEPGEIIREGDEYWHPVKGWRSPVWGSNGRPVETEQPIRRRMEPEPVKAELLEAAQTAANVLAALATGQISKIERNSPALLALRAAIARATT